MDMSFDSAFFNGAVIDEHDLGHIATQEHGPSDDGTTTMQPVHPQRQTFYPTPNSSNMHAGNHEKSFMSPFPGPYQKYPAMTLENSFSDLDELLFTPMLSPAMTPMQQYSGMERITEADWDQFDQTMFALTGPAMENMQHAMLQQQMQSAVPTTTVLEPVTKKQRVSNDSVNQSRHTSPRTSSMNDVRPTGAYHHKRDNSMAPPPMVSNAVETSSDSNEGVSPVDLEQFQAQSMPPQAIDDLDVAGHVQPITPSMLMSIQSKPKEPNDLQTTALSLDLTPSCSFPMMTDSQAMPSPSRITSSSATRPTTTPRMTATSALSHPNREIRPRPIAPAHTKSRSLHSSPALGPQRPKPSPELRPILPGGMSPQVGAMLASKSNYQHIVDGTYDQLNISFPHGMTQGLEVRRTSHKAAEQKRRDHLKDCFEQLRTILPDGPEPGASKVAILRKGYEHILELHSKVKAKDAEIARLKQELEKKVETETEIEKDS